MKNKSLGGLINLSALNRIVKNADQIFWSYEDGWNIVSDGHFIFYFCGQCDALFTRFQKLPEGKMLCARKREKSIEVFESPVLDNMKKYLNADGCAEVVDTRLSYETAQGNTVRVLHSADKWNEKAYVYISDAFFRCISEFYDIYAERAGRTLPVTFRNGEEKAVILPVNIYNPAFLAE